MPNDISMHYPHVHTLLHLFRTSMNLYNLVDKVLSNTTNYYKEDKENINMKEEKKKDKHQT
jgi:hypothetical protein